MQNWTEYIANLHGEPHLFDAEIEKLRKITAEKPWEEANFFLLAKLYENYPFEETSHHEQFDKAVLRWAGENYNRAIAIKPLPEYLAEREKFRKNNSRALEKPQEISEKPQNQAIPEKPKNEAMYYRSSGKMNFSAPVFLAVICATAIPVLGFLYAFVSAEVPYVALKLIFPILFGVLAGACINMAIIGFGKTRSGFWGFILASLATVWAYYLHWVFYFVYISGKNLNVNFSALISKEGADFFHRAFYLVKNPGLVWELLGKYTHIGSWSFMGIDFDGGLLIFFLVLEFILIYLSSVFIGFMNYDKPFDELNNQWFKYEFYENKKYFLPQDQLVSRLESGQYRGLLDVDENKVWTDDAGIYFSRHTLFSNGRQYYLSVDNMVRKFENKTWTTKSTELVRYISIPQDFAMEIRAKNEKLPLKESVAQANP